MQSLKSYLGNLTRDPRTRHPGHVEIFLRGRDGFYVPLETLHYRNQKELITMVKGMAKSSVSGYMRRIVLSSSFECRHKINLLSGRIRLLPVYTFRVSLSRHRHPASQKPSAF